MVNEDFPGLVHAVSLGLIATCLSFGQTAVTLRRSGNAASFVPGQTVSPGSIVAIFGTQLAAQLASAIHCAAGDFVGWRFGHVQ